MCLILIAHLAHPRYRLVVAANRDEFFRRPTSPADYWRDAPHVLGGRDLDKGGTWMAVARDGRWAAVTNFRDGMQAAPAARSRGELVANFVLPDAALPGVYAATVRDIADEFAGFNLLTGNSSDLHYLSNRRPGQVMQPTPLRAGIYGLSNGWLDTPWPKVERGKQALESALDEAIGPDQLSNALLQVLSDRCVAKDHELPSTGVAEDWEKCLSAAFIGAPGYGTRASSVLVMEHDGEIHFRERSFGERGELTEDRTFRFAVDRAAG